MNLDFPEVIEDIIDNGGPHVLVGFLNFAVGTKVRVDNLIGIEDILPDIKESVGVSEGKDNKGGVDTEYAFDIFLLLFDVVDMKRPVAFFADVTFPVDDVKLVVSSDDHGVGKEHSFYIG